MANLSFSNLFVQSFEWYKRNFWRILPSLLLSAFSYWAVFVYLQQVLLPNILKYNFFTDPLFWIFWLGIFYLFCLVSLLLLIALKDESKGIKAIFQEGFSMIFAFCFLNIIVAFINGLGFLLFIVPGLILSIYLGFSIFVFVEEKTSPILAIRKSYDLVKGNWLKVFKYYLLLALLFFCLGLLSNTIIALSSLSVSSGALLSEVLSIFLLNPLSIAFHYFLYKSISSEKASKIEEVELTQ